MKTYSFKTCKGTLKFVAETRFAALRLFHLLVRKTRNGKYIPIAKEKRQRILDEKKICDGYDYPFAILDELTAI